MIEGGTAGPWRPATLHTPPLGPAAWVQWRVDLAAPSRPDARVEARAVDGLGRVQTVERSGPFPSGATGLHALAVPNADP
jgi:hypothetical protein